MLNFCARDVAWKVIRLPFCARDIPWKPGGTFAYKSPWSDPGSSETFGSLDPSSPLENLEAYTESPFLKSKIISIGIVYEG
jgi:hypothetical protein